MKLAGLKLDNVGYHDRYGIVRIRESRSVTAALTATRAGLVFMRFGSFLSLAVPHLHRSSITSNFSVLRCCLNLGVTSREISRVLSHYDDGKFIVVTRLLSHVFPSGTVRSVYKSTKGYTLARNGSAQSYTQENHGDSVAYVSKFSWACPENPEGRDVRACQYTRPLLRGPDDFR